MLLALTLSVLAADGGADAGLLQDAGVRVDAGVALGPCREAQDICFSPGGNCDMKVVSLVDRSKNSLDILIYSINRPSIIDAILRAKARGVVVRIVVDATQIGEPKEQFQLQRLLAVGIPMRRDTHQGSMHMKVIVVDGKEFLTGSFNFTNNASENNDENILIWDCPRNAMLFKLRFEMLWGKYKDASDSVLKGADGGVDAGR